MYAMCTRIGAESGYPARKTHQPASYGLAGLATSSALR
jgi:hypothetical protein